MIDSVLNLPCLKADRLRTDQRLVTKIPLTELWNEAGTIPSECIRSIDEGALLELIRSCSVQFVIADCGLKLDWIPIDNRFSFWKTVRSQIADPTKPIFLGSFPQETAYVASEWRGRAGECLVLLEKYH